MSSPPTARRSSGPRGPWILAAIVLALTAFNSFLTWVSAFDTPEWIDLVLIGAWVFQPMLFAVWTALGPGWFLVRLSVLIPAAIVAAALPAVLPGGWGEIDRYEFQAAAIVSIGIYFTTTAIFLLLRLFCCWHITVPDMSRPSRLQFSMKYLICLATLYGITLAIATNLTFAEPSGGFMIGLVVGIIYSAGATFGALLLPVAAVPLLCMMHRFYWRPVLWAVALWILVTIAVMILWLMLDDVQILPAALLVQLGGGIVGAAVGWAVRKAGYRVDRASAAHQLATTVSQA